jgi:hypothetical protein
MMIYWMIAKIILVPSLVFKDTIYVASTNLDQFIHSLADLASGWLDQDAPSATPTWHASSKLG